MTVDGDGHVAVVTLRRPPHNLLTVPLLRSLADALTAAASSHRVLVLCSEGRSFCAGADFRSSEAPDPAARGDTFGAQTSLFYAEAARIFELPVPVVAAVQGPAIGAGFGLALACDLRVVGQGGWFQANFVRLGIHPGFALSATLPRLVGQGVAADLFLTGRRVDASTALSMGLASRVVDGASDVVAAAIELAGEIAAGAPLAVHSTRATLRAGLAGEAREAMHHELAEQRRLAGTGDAIEGVAAMLEGRTPDFHGR